ncbi:MAG: MarR family transcriptional regulator [Pseudomonadales bacterium]|nr:MarR family transcriptional regulator [Pseudomonadales bacterium]
MNHAPFDPDPLKSPGYQVRATHRAFDRLLQRQIRKHRISNGFWYVLRALWRRENMSQRELADEVNLTESSTVLLLDSMERAGLVRRKRDTEDRRRIRIHLTPKARRLEARLLPNVEEINAMATEGIPPGDLEVFLRTAIRMRANLMRHLAAGPEAS